jgi:hypothetical protein
VPGHRKKGRLKKHSSTGLFIFLWGIRINGYGL